MHAHSGSALAVAVDVDAWLSPDAAGRDASGMLSQQGWRAVALGPADRLEAVWEELGRRHTQSSRSRGAAPGAADGPGRSPSPTAEGVAVPCPRPFAPDGAGRPLGRRRGHHPGLAADLAGVHRGLRRAPWVRCSSSPSSSPAPARSVAGGGCRAALLVLAQVLLVAMVVCAFVVRLAAADRRRVGPAADRVPGRRAEREPVRSPGPRRRAARAPAADRRRRRLPAARRRPRLHAAPGAAGRAAAADDLQRAGEHDRRRARTGSSTRSPRSASSR